MAKDSNVTSYHGVPVRAPSVDSLNIEDHQREERFQDKIQDYGVEQHPIDVPPPAATGVASQRGRKSPWKVIVKMAVFFFFGLALMAGHAGFFMWLDGRAVSEAGISQEYQTTVGNLFAIVAEGSLLGGIGLAYDQFLWRMFRRKSLKAGTIDTLMGLTGSPWDLLSLDILRDAAPAALIGFLCALFPIAAMFPPGAVTVEFVNRAVPETLRNVPTMNVSDFGDFGNEMNINHQMVQRSFIELEGSMSALEHRELDDLYMINPRLLAMASQVLSSGEPVLLPSPCKGPCAYTLPIRGPRFHCEKAPARESLISVDDCENEGFKTVYTAVDKASLVNRTNSFVMSWYEDAHSEDCGREAQQTLDCSVTLAEYTVDIETFQDQSRKIKVKTGNEEEILNEDNGFTDSFYEWFFPSDTLEDPEQAKKFVPILSAFQAFGISRAATNALQGDLTYVSDGVAPSFRGTATTITGSPYIGFADKVEAKFSITAEKIEQFLEDLVVSTIALNPADKPLWVHNEEIIAMAGANVYVFQDKMHFFVPYALCLAVTAAIYALGFWSLKRKGVSAQSGFLQVVATTSDSAGLKSATNGSGAGGEYISDELDGIRLRFGIHKGSSYGGAYEGARGQYLIQEGFGTESELER